ncbi:hypothetical protein B0H12DRAFT_1246359 [Mycena haematopus]|nr:hypothetical protein B0H12DRAFT_1246359 [Mycena haematopus]
MDQPPRHLGTPHLRVRDLAYQILLRRLQTVLQIASTTLSRRSVGRAATDAILAWREKLRMYKIRTWSSSYCCCATPVPVHPHPETPNLKAHMQTASMLPFFFPTVCLGWIEHGTTTKLFAADVQPTLMRFIRRADLPRMYGGWSYRMPSSLDEEIVRVVRGLGGVAGEGKRMRGPPRWPAPASDESSLVSYFLGVHPQKHHLRLVSKTAILSNDLIKRDVSAKGNGRADRTILPTLPLIQSGEVFGLVRSQHADTFGGLISFKDEDDEDGLSLFDEPSLNFESSRILSDMNIDASLVSKPLAKNTNNPFRPFDVPSPDFEPSSDLNIDPSLTSTPLEINSTPCTGAA